MTGSCALHVADALESDSELGPPPKGTAAGTDLSADAIERGSPFGIRSPRPALALVCGVGSLYSLGGSQVMAIDVGDSADASGSYGGHATLGTVSALSEPEPSEDDPSEVEDPSDVDEVPGAAGTSTHSRGV